MKHHFGILALAAIGCLISLPSIRAQETTTNQLAARTELHPIQTLTLSDQQFLRGEASGATFEVPGDRVLYECEPGYAYFEGRHLKQNRADRAYEAQQVRRLRQQAGLTQEALAKRAGLARPNLARVESGRYRPSLETLERIASALGQPVSVLIAAPPALPSRVGDSPGIFAREEPRELHPTTLPTAFTAAATP